GCQTSIQQPTESFDTPTSFNTSIEFELGETLDSFINDGAQLPSKTKDNQDIIWSVSEGNATIEDNIIHKSSNALEYEPIKLEATIDKQTYRYSRLLLLDPYVAYLISYFSSADDGSEVMKLAYTYNGLYWFKLNQDETILAPTIGTKRMRDPSTVRKKDGSFSVLATQGYDTDSIYVFDTKDFITYENERLLKVNTSSSNQKMSEKQAWSPEAFYDRTIDQYVIYWSSVEDKGMYYNISSDLNTFTPPRKLLDTGYPIIDGTITKVGNEYSIIFKDEREPMEEYSQLRKGYSKEHWYAFQDFSEPITGHQSEGPMVMKAFDFDGYYLFYDDYTRYQFQAFETDDLFNGKLKPIEQKDMLIPLDSPAHSYAIAITWKELERLLQEFGE
ncbi:MAG: glycoside hydrolase family 43 protein, partial [Solobacterium sp.]|nr:glycoside hydrolase family 43 protein [Solobacterium sp.]